MNTRFACSSLTENPLSIQDCCTIQLKMNLLGCVSPLNITLVVLGIYMYNVPKAIIFFFLTYTSRARWRSWRHRIETPKSLLPRICNYFLGVDD